jgi:hypothetical protein
LCSSEAIFEYQPPIPCILRAFVLCLAIAHRYCLPLLHEQRKVLRCLKLCAMRIGHPTRPRRALETLRGMAESGKLPVSAMLAQYLVGLCALQWDAESVSIEVVVGDVVEDAVTGSGRDVDVTVTVDAADEVFAFKGYEVKNWTTALSVDDIEAQVTKFNDLPPITHRAIVSASGYSEDAITKALHYGFDLYEFKRWERPLEEQFPHLGMKGTPTETIRSAQFLLTWPASAFWLGTDSPPFNLEPGDTLFAADGKKHSQYPTFGAYQDAMILRSTETLWNLPPFQAIVDPLQRAFSSDEPIPDEPQWPHTHTIDVRSDEVYVSAQGDLDRIDTCTINGELKWVHRKMLYYVMEKVPTGEVFAGSVIAPGDKPGQMWAIVFSGKDARYSTRAIQLKPEQLNSIRKLEIAIREDTIGG